MTKITEKVGKLPSAPAGLVAAGQQYRNSPPPFAQGSAGETGREASNV